MKPILLLLFTCIYAASIAQKTGLAFIDSVLPVIAAAKEDSNKVLLLHQTGVVYNSMDAEKAMQYANAGRQLAEKINWKKGIAKCWHLTGSILMNRGAYDSAMLDYQKSLGISETIADAKGEAAAYINMGLTESVRGNYPQAMEYVTKAAPKAAAIKDTNYLSLIYNLISNIYFYQQDYKKATEYTSKSLKLAQLTGNEINQAHAYASLGTQAHAQNDTVKAMAYYYKAYAIFKKKQNLQRQAALLGNIAILQKDKRQAIELKLKAQQIWDALSPTYPDAIKNTGNLGIDYFDLVRSPQKFPVIAADFIPEGKADRLALAEKYLKRAVMLSKEVGNMEWNWTYNNELSALMETKGDTKSALAYLKDSWKVYDSLYSQENKNKLAEIATRQEIALRDKQLQINKLALSNQRKQRLALVMGLILLTMIGILLYLQSRNRKRTNTILVKLNTDLDEANKLKAKFFAILSHDLRSPIASLMSFLEIQEDAPGMISPEEAIAHNKNISASASNLLQTMEAMLLWSKEQMQQFKPDIKSVPVNNLFEYLRHFFTANGKIDLHFSNPENISIKTDENYMQTIMQNLTANAIKILKGKPGAVINWKAWSEAGKNFLSITDNGPGMKEAEAAALYNDSTRMNSHTGFGLHLIHDLAKTIRCKIIMQSNTGTGTTFTLET